MAINFPSSPATNATYSYGGRTWKFDGTVWRQVPTPPAFSINTQIETQMQASEVVGRHVCVDPFRIEAGATGCIAKFNVAATAAVTITLKKNDTTIGTIDIGVAGTLGTWTVASAVDFAVGDFYTLTNGGTADATLREGAIDTRCTRL